MTDSCGIAGKLNRDLLCSLCSLQGSSGRHLSAPLRWNCRSGGWKGLGVGACFTGCKTRQEGDAYKLKYAGQMQKNTHKFAL